MSFSGKTELRYAAEVDEVNVLCKRFAEIMQEELEMHRCGDEEEENDVLGNEAPAAVSETPFFQEPPRESCRATLAFDGDYDTIKPADLSYLQRNL